MLASIPPADLLKNCIYTRFSWYPLPTKANSLWRAIEQHSGIHKLKTAAGIPSFVLSSRMLGFGNAIRPRGRPNKKNHVHLQEDNCAFRRISTNFWTIPSPFARNSGERRTAQKTRIRHTVTLEAVIRLAWGRYHSIPYSTKNALAFVWGPPDGNNTSYKSNGIILYQGHMLFRIM